MKNICFALLMLLCACMKKDEVFDSVNGISDAQSDAQMVQKFIAKNNITAYQNYEYGFYYSVLNPGDSTTFFEDGKMNYSISINNKFSSQLISDNERITICSKERIQVAVRFALDNYTFKMSRIIIYVPIMWGYTSYEATFYGIEKKSCIAIEISAY